MPDEPSDRHRQPLGWLVPVVVAGLFAGMSAGCDGRSGEARDRDAVSEAALGLPGDGSRAEAPPGVRLVLTIEPQIGDAPLTVELRAVLEGDLEEPDRYRCATAAFALGDDNVQLIPPPDDCTDDVQRDYATTHTYAAAGSYRASVRLIARPVAPSKPVQILVRGPTPTAAPLAANPGPTIVIATTERERPTEQAPAPDDTAAADAAPEDTAPPPSARPTRTARTSTARPPEATRRPSTAVAQAPAAVVTAPSSPAGTATAPTSSVRIPPAWTRIVPTPPGMLAVLPADLYYLHGDPPRLWRLPASGDEPEALDLPDEVTDQYAVSSIGFIARHRDRTITVQAPTGGERTLFEPDGSVWGLAWSRDGHQLAYNVGGNRRLFDVVTYSERDLGLVGGTAPMAFSRDGKWLLEGLDNGALGLVEMATGKDQRIPLDEGVGARAGWLPDRNVLWSTGMGLRFVTVDDPLTITPVIEPDVQTSTALVRSDQQMLVLVGRELGSVLARIDLTSPSISAEIVGAHIAVSAGADIAWAPDGRTIAVAGEKGLTLVDPATGARVPLIDGPTRDPTWVIGGR